MTIQSVIDVNMEDKSVEEAIREQFEKGMEESTCTLCPPLKLKKKEQVEV